jgi:threonine/homoserine/homoserine lactone efflux protein
MTRWEQWAPVSSLRVTMSATTLLLFGLAAFLLTVSPGPGVLYVTARSLSQGRRAGFASMLGIESGEVVWLVAAATGVAALLSASVQALTILRFAGAAYLIYLGVQRWRAADLPVAPSFAPIGRIFIQGFVTQILNPKVAVFFLAFLPEFLNPNQPIGPQVAVLGVIYIAVAVAVDVTYVLAASAIGRRFMRSRIAQRRTGRVAAATYFALGLAAAASGAKKT